jgi:excisionase family DNA binding protein
MLDMIDYEEAAQILGIVPTSVYQLTRDGKLHPVKVPGKLKKLLSRQEVEAYAKSRYSRTPEPEPEPEPAHVNNSQSTVTPPVAPAPSNEQELPLALRFTMITGNIYKSIADVVFSKLCTTLTPIAESIGKESNTDLAALTEQFALSFMATRPEIKNGEVNEDTLQSLFSHPALAGETDALNLLRDKAKQVGLYTVPAPAAMAS